MFFRRHCLQTPSSMLANMAVNLAKHRDELLSAWKEVVDDKAGTNWALFGYDKQTYDLCVVGKGAGGLEELTEELNCGKVMYAFCKVQDPSTSLSKFVLINWQGEGVPLVKKGCCANHLMDISNFFRGSVYKRIQPAREIASTEREKFWMKEQEEEKKRIKEEKLKAEAAKSRLAEQVKERELKDAQAREEWFKERSLSIDKMREAEKNAQNSTHNKVNKKLWEQQLQEDKHDEEERKCMSQSLRNRRSEEAQALIAQRTTDAKAMFEPSTCTGAYASQASAALSEQTNLKGTASQAEAPAVQNNHGAALASSPTKLTYTRNQLQDAQTTCLGAAPPEPAHNQSWEDEDGIAEVSRPASEAVEGPGLNQAQPASVETSEPEIRARALYDYQAADDTEISFDPDDIITHIEQIDEGWWQGLGPDGTYGLFPANYVELIE
ncbi:actin binding protein 1 isoform X2 [Amblyomma americanum]